MSRYNKFGATYSQVLAMYPGTVLADYDGGGANGQAVIESVLDRIAREVALALSPECYAQMTQVDCQEVVRYAAADQTSATLGLDPLVADSLHMWVYPPVAALEVRDYGFDSSINTDDWYRKPVLGLNEISSDDYSVSGDVVTLSNGLGLGERVFASYDVDVDDEDFAMPSVADLVLLGTAAEMGSRLFSDAQQEWKLVTTYAENFKARMELVVKGEWIPDEIRALNYFKEVERTSSTGVSSVRLYRG